MPSTSTTPVKKRTGKPPRDLDWDDFDVDTVTAFLDLLEAIAALLEHKSLRVIMRYARIANRTVGDEYQAVRATVEALYALAPTALGDDAEGRGCGARTTHAGARDLNLAGVGSRTTRGGHAHDRI